MPGMAIAEAPTASTKRKDAKTTIEVRSLNLLSCKGQTERLMRYLCPSERQRASRFHYRADYERYVAARAALRLQLGDFLDRDPNSLTFKYTSQDKPYLEDCAIEFNVSHSGDWVLFAFSRSGEIGVDIEHIRPIPDMANVARQNFAEPEFASWEALPDRERIAAFYRCWTRKESFIKAIGQGLSYPLDSFEVTFDPTRPASVASVNGDESLAAEWWMADLPGFNGYAAAVTMRKNFGNEARVSMKQIESADLQQHSAEGIV
jgi:4'-phosphopantetheinyl transferase